MECVNESDVIKIGHKSIRKVENKKKYYNKTNSCDICGINFKNTYGFPIRQYNKEGNWTGKWLCLKCYKRTDYNKRPDTQANILKNIKNCRTGYINLNSNQVKGNIFEELTCRWREVKNLNKELDCYNTPIDHTKDPKLGIIQTKGRSYQDLYQCWTARCDNEFNKEFDHLIFYCTDKDGKIIERVYIFPKEEIIKRISITIRNNIGWYKKYRVNEETVKHINAIYQNILKELCRKLNMKN